MNRITETFIKGSMVIAGVGFLGLVGSATKDRMDRRDEKNRMEKQRHENLMHELKKVRLDLEKLRSSF
jgi:hypothetical protein